MKSNLEDIYFGNTNPLYMEEALEIFADSGLFKG